MLRVQKDFFTRVTEVTEAWGRLRPTKIFFGLSLEDFKVTSKTFLDARAEILDLEKQTAHATSKRDAAEGPLLETLQGVVNAVKGDPTEGQNGELYGAMGYIPKNQRATGLVRPRKGTPVTEGGST